MLRVYEKDLTGAGISQALMGGGLGILTHCLTAVRHQTINGDWSLTVTYPLDAPGAALLQPERLICYDDDTGSQLYRISRRKPKNTRQGRVMEVEAPHAAYDLRHKYIVNLETKEDDRYPDGIDAATALTQLLEGTGFSVGAVTVPAKLDYLDILQKDVMSAIKEQLLEKWGGELVYDNFTVHLLAAAGQDRRYPIRDGRNIAEITVTEDYDPVVTRLHVRGYENANFEDINGGKDWIDSPLIGQYSHVREGYADFADEDDPSELMRMGQEKLRALEVPEITYDIRLADMRGTVQYDMYRRLEAFGLGDTAVLHSDAIDRDVILRCSELETDCLTGRNTRVTLGNTDKAVIASITAGASASDRLASILTPQGYLQAEKIAGKINLVRVQNLEAEIANIARATIGTAQINVAQINDLSAEVARIVVASIQTAEIDWASITTLTTAVAEIVTAQIGTVDIDWARIKDLVSGKAIFTQGVAGEFYIAKLAVTEANLVRLSVGELLVRGQDGAFYAVSVDSDGQIISTKKQVENGDIKDATIHAGEKIIDGTITAAKINAQDVFADNAIIRQLMAANIDVDTLFSREATITALNAANISNNQSLKLMVGGVQESANSAIQLLRDRVATAVTQIEQVQGALGGKADAGAVTQLGTQLQQTASDITAIIRRTEGLEAGQSAADAVLQQYQLTFRIAADGVTIGKSGSDFDVRINNQQMAFRERGVVVAYISNNRLYVSSAEITKSLTMGNYAWQTLSDGSMGLVFGG